ncbi:hypothetical protein XHV734_0373 [Xanthomonas hortorum pv. vitians]|nr:hypothetical protein XHV734_0373 [Xanthomonas hortorum pv. vitians]
MRVRLLSSLDAAVPSSALRHLLAMGEGSCGARRHGLRATGVRACCAGAPAQAWARNEAVGDSLLKARGDAFVIARTDSSLRRTLIRPFGYLLPSEEVIPKPLSCGRGVGVRVRPPSILDAAAPSSAPSGQLLPMGEGKNAAATARRIFCNA